MKSKNSLLKMMLAVLGMAIATQANAQIIINPPNQNVTEVFKLHFDPMSEKGTIWAEIDDIVVAKTSVDGMNASLLKITAPSGKAVVWRNSRSSMGLKILMDGKGEYSNGEHYGHYVVFSVPQTPQASIDSVSALIQNTLHTSLNGAIQSAVLNEFQTSVASGTTLLIKGPNYSSLMMPGANQKGLQSLSLTAEVSGATNGDAIYLQSFDSSTGATVIVAKGACTSNPNVKQATCSLSANLDLYYLYAGAPIRVSELPRGRYLLLLKTANAGPATMKFSIQYSKNPMIRIDEPVGPASSATPSATPSAAPSPTPAT